MEKIKSSIIEFELEEENPVEDFTKAMIVLNGPHEIAGSFGYDFDDIDEEIDFLFSDIDNMSPNGYNTDNHVFSTPKEAFEEEMKFSKECFTDFLKYNITPYLNFKNKEEKYAFNKTTKSIINEAIGVEMRVYPGNKLDSSPHIVFVHDGDWDVFLFGLLELPAVSAAIIENSHDFGLLTKAAKYKGLIPSEE